MVCGTVKLPVNSFFDGKQSHAAVTCATRTQAAVYERNPFKTIFIAFCTN